jgi:hypothetical protein
VKLIIPFVAAGLLVASATARAQDGGGKVPQFKIDATKELATSLGVPSDLQTMGQLLSAMQNAVNHLGGELDTLEAVVQKQLADDETQKATLIEWLKTAQGGANSKK